MERFCDKCKEKTINRYSKTGLCASCAMTGKKRPDMVGNTYRKGISPAWKGQKLGPANITEEERERRSENAKKVFEPFKFKKGQPSWNKGKPAPWAKGEKNYFWKGGATKKNAETRRSHPLIEWRMRVLTRDNFTCQLCGKYPARHADHIKSFAVHPELRTDLSNGRTLCLDCHKKTPSFLNSKKAVL